MQYLYDIGYLHIIVYQYVAEEKLSNGEIFKSAWSFILSLSISTNWVYVVIIYLSFRPFSVVLIKDSNVL